MQPRIKSREERQADGWLPPVQKQLQSDGETSASSFSSLLHICYESTDSMFYDRPWNQTACGVCDAVAPASAIFIVGSSIEDERRVSPDRENRWLARYCDNICRCKLRKHPHNLSSRVALVKSRNRHVLPLIIACRFSFFQIFLLLF